MRFEWISRYRAFRTGRSWIGCALVLAVAAPVRAQLYDIETFTEGEGLPSSTVRGVAQEPSGRMWFSTSAGIAMWDGQRWTIHGEAEGLRYRDRSSIEIDERGTPWSLATMPAVDVAHWDGERWTSLPPPDLPPLCALRDLAVAQGAPPERLAVGSSCGLVVRENGAWRRIERGLPSERVTAVERFADRWVVATVAGPAIVRDGAGEAEAPPFDLPAGPVLGLASDPSVDTPRLLVTGIDWIGYVEGDRYVPLGSLEADARVMPRAIAPDGNGGMFFGTTVAFHHFHPSSGLRLLDERNGLASAGAEDLLFDREGNVWVAAVRGASRIGSFRFATYRREHGLLQDEVTAILERRDGEILLGHSDGLTRVEGGSMRTLSFRGTVPTRYGLGRVLDLAEQSDGTIWIAANERGLGRMVGDEVSWSRRGEQFGITSVRVDFDDHLWVADGKKVLVDRGSGLVRVPLEFRGNYGVRRLLLGADGAIYVASMGSGLYRWNGSGWDAWHRPGDAKLNNIYAVSIRTGGRTWVGTAAGLAEASDGMLRKLDTPAIDRPVYFILDDADDRTWFGTDNGVLRWDGRRLEQFSVEQGLGGRETNRAAGLVDSDGRIWIGTTRGVTVYRPELDRRIPVAPTIRLVGIQTAHEPVDLARTIHLGPSQNDLVFSFRAIHFADADDLVLQSRLEGYEDGWSAPYASRDGLARYTSLPPGSYRFHVRAGIASGEWSEPVSSPEVVIVGPFWSRPWFWALGALLASALGYAGHRYVYQFRYARHLEVEVASRVDELRRAEAELAKARRLQSLGVLAGGIAHDFNNLLTVVLGNLALLGESTDRRSRRWVTDAEAAINRARELTGQLLTFSKGGAPVRGPARLQQVIHDSVRFVSRGSNVRCEVVLDADLHVVRIDAGQINQVLNNLLINATQAMPEGGVVRVTARNVDGIPSLSRTGRHVAIEVRDGGVGIPSDVVPRIFDPYFSTKEGGSGLGLATSYSIVHRHDGLLTVDSRPGQGSTFTVYLPACDDPLVEPAPRKPAERFEGVRVLVMDDDDAVREVVRRMLRAVGCEVSVAADGREAVEIYGFELHRGRPFDAVILDLTVPGGMGGEETMRRLAEIDPDVRAIVASGYSNAPILANPEEYGFKSVLRKPFERADIVEALREVLRVGVA